MVDSVAVFPPGWRATSTSNEIITDGVLSFFDAGTENTRTVYSDSSLSIALGVTVNCNSGGYPITSGNARTIIYTGNTPYKIRLSSVLAGGTIFEHDNVSGALDTSSFLTSSFVSSISNIAKSTNYNITTADKGKLINFNCTSGTLQATLDAASTLGDGWWCGIRHDGTANYVKIIADGIDVFYYGDTSNNITGFSLNERGHTVWITCNGGDFYVYSEFPPNIGNTVGVLRIRDRLSAPLGSENPGDRYIIAGTPTGAWSTFTEHDIVEANGFGSWIRYIPTTDCGWIAWVQDENIYYRFTDSAWASFIATDTNYGFTVFASQAQMEALTSGVVVPANRVHFSPPVAKAWVRFNGSVASIDSSYNVTSVGRSSAGQYTVNMTTGFSGTTYCAVSSLMNIVGTTDIVQVSVASATQLNVQVSRQGVGAVDGNPGIALFGDL